MANGTGAALYDGRTEANLVGVRASPGVVFLRLRRDFPGEPKHAMFTELSPAEAMRVRDQLDACIRISLCRNGGPQGR